MLIALFIKETWDAKKKVWMSMLFVLLASIGHLFYSGEFDLTNLPETFLKIFGLAVITYKGFWNPSGAINLAEKTGPISSSAAEIKLDKKAKSDDK
jgi:hypothetical protein